MINKYHPSRLVIALSFFSLAIYTLLQEITALGGDDLFIVLARLVDSIGLQWIASFLERISGDYYKIGMFFALFIFVMYGFLQIVGTLYDRKMLQQIALLPIHRDQGAITNPIASPRLHYMLLAITARSDIFSNPSSIHQAIPHHFKVGRTNLLSPIVFSLWAFPVIGFIGTVLGISQAVKDLPMAMKNETALSRVLDSLHLAFDTTFIGLLSSVFIMAIITALQNQWLINEAIATTNPPHTP